MLPWAPAGPGGRRADGDDAGGSRSAWACGGVRARRAPERRHRPAPRVLLVAPVPTSTEDQTPWGPSSPVSGGRTGTDPARPALDAREDRSHDPRHGLRGGPGHVLHTPDGAGRRPGRDSATPARRLRDALEPLAMVTVWSEPAADQAAAAGLDFLAGYVGGRASVLGDVPGTVVASTFAVFEPNLAGGLWDQARASCSVAQLQQGRERAGTEALRAALPTSGSPGRRGRGGRRGRHPARRARRGRPHGTPALRGHGGAALARPGPRPPLARHVPAARAPRRLPCRRLRRRRARRHRGQRPHRAVGGVRPARVHVHARVVAGVDGRRDRAPAASRPARGGRALRRGTPRARRDRGRHRPRPAADRRPDR